MRKIFVFLFMSFKLFSQTPGVDTLVIYSYNGETVSTNVATGTKRSTTVTGYYFQLGHHELLKVKGKNFRKVVSVFPESSKLYRKSTKSAKWATVYGITAVAFVGPMLAGAIIGGREIGDDPLYAAPFLGMCAIGATGVFVFPRIARKKAKKSLEYFEESVNAYNSQIKHH